MQLDWMFAMSVLGVPHIVLICAVLLCSVLLAVGIIDGNRFVVVQEKFTLPHLTKPCKFVLISDLHNKVYGKENNKVIAAIRKIRGFLSLSKPPILPVESFRTVWWITVLYISWWRRR